MTDLVLVERRGPAAWITLNRPEKLNALTEEMVDGLFAALDGVVRDDEVKLAVLTGAGRAFSAGYDISEEGANPDRGAEWWHHTLERDVNLALAVWSLPKPTIAAVRGWCLGGACELAMACDLIVCAEDAKLGEPEIRFGSGPVALLMPFMLGQKKTNELLFTGDTIDAAEAHRLGLVNRVVPGEDLDAAVEELVRKIAPTPLATLRLTKLALTRAYEAMGLRQAVHANLDLSAILNAVDAPELREFNEIARTQGLKAALAWRDARYGAP